MSAWRWLRRWHKIGYRELWHLHYGGSHEGDKGCTREYDFMLEITQGWHNAFYSERSLLLEAEELLRDNKIPVPTEARYAALVERLKNRHPS